MNQSNQRKLSNKFKLNPASQLQVGLWIFLNGFLLSTILYAMFFYVFSGMITNIMILSPGNSDVAVVAENTQTTLWTMFGLFTLISLLSAAYLTVKISSRFLGPIVPARRFVRALIDGKPEGPLVLRKGDEFELTNDLNELGKKLYPDLQVSPLN